MSPNMKNIASVSLLTSLTSVVTAAYSPFDITSLTAHQPNGNPEGQVNHYTIEFNVSSTNGDSPQSAYCYWLWGDNYCSGSGCVAYSTDVPVDQWIKCAHNKTAYDNGKYREGQSEFAFQLYPYFTIGNFSIAIQQNFTDTDYSHFDSGHPAQVIAQSAPYQITNTSTPAYTCKINPQEVKYQVHASGTCTTSSNSTSLSLPVADYSLKCEDGSNGTSINLSFEVYERTVWGENVFVTGNIPELGNWDSYNAVALNADRYTEFSVMWQGGDVGVPAGQTFEYKYIKWGLNGELVWECGANRVYTASNASCLADVVDQYKGYFRDGDIIQCDNVNGKV